MILQSFCCNLETHMVFSAAKHKYTSEALCLIGHVLVQLQNGSSEQVFQVVRIFLGLARVIECPQYLH